MTTRRKRIITIILLVWVVILMVDASLAFFDKTPIFAVPLKKYKDGGSAEYYGLGYKVIKYVDLSVEKGPELQDVAFGSWFMEFSKPD